MASDDALRRQLLELLRGGHAHMTFDEAVADFPMERVNTKIPNGSYTPWAIIEHMRLTQRDILEFMTNPDYEEPKWPDDYWPPQDATADAGVWRQTIDDFHADLATLEAMVQDPQVDLDARIPKGTGQTPLREFLLVADHNAYHIGEFAVLRQVMGTWPADRQE